ncbi:hypothetical protein [Ramlibacter sp. WS9]|uniref:hypothetical protein n=1 Tax=Ramlibacter sp. WS9 TaxID=1882741 RepID=UPI0013052306|nr:hypothetical protein [Ramlibacter sp. WS9]
MFRVFTLLTTTALSAAVAMATPDFSDEEPGHPIPHLGVVDVHAVRKGGGSDLNVVIATPLQGDEHSRQRLTRKIENYLRAINSNGYSAQFGQPTPKNTAIVVHIHPRSDPKIFKLLEKLRSRVGAAKVAFEIKPLEVNQ